MMEPLTVPGTLDSLAEVRKYVTAAAHAAGLDKKASYRLKLAVDEIATNVITHGYIEASLEGALDLRADLDERALVITMEDTGAAYDPGLHYDHDDLNQPADQRPIGGLGVFLAIQSVDRFLYERASGGRGRHIFMMNRTSASPKE